MRNRQRHASNVRTFLEVLVEIAAGAAAGAKAAVRLANEERHSLLATAAKLALLVSDSASPFVVDSDAAVAVLALDAITSALRALNAVNAVPKPDNDVVRDPLPPFLPHVHVLWPVYVTAVSKGHPAAARRSLALIPDVAVLCGGEFLRDRVKSDLWPLIERMLSPIDINARTRHAALECIERLANHDASREAMYHVVMQAAEALAALLHPHCGLDASAAQCAERALESLSTLDSDGVFLLKWRLGRVRIPSMPSCRRDASKQADCLFAPL